MGDVRPQQREEQPSLGVLRRPEAEDPGPAAEQEARALSEVRGPEPLGFYCLTTAQSYLMGKCMTCVLYMLL